MDAISSPLPSTADCPARTLQSHAAIICSDILYLQNLALFQSSVCWQWKKFWARECRCGGLEHQILCFRCQYFDIQDEEIALDRRPVPDLQHCTPRECSLLHSIRQFLAVFQRLYRLECHNWSALFCLLQSFSVACNRHRFCLQLEYQKF